jgi:hypothetical protein
MQDEFHKFCCAKRSVETRTCDNYTDYDNEEAFRKWRLFTFFNLINQEKLLPTHNVYFTFFFWFQCTFLKWQYCGPLGYKNVI